MNWRLTEPSNDIGIDYLHKSLLRVILIIDAGNLALVLPLGGGVEAVVTVGLSSGGVLKGISRRDA